MLGLGFIKPKDVAPHTGAWIETFGLLEHEYQLMSHPTRVRGLKLTFKPIFIRYLPSHPTRVRGLKPMLVELERNFTTSHPTRVRGLKPTNGKTVYFQMVAPHTGAWIETLLYIDL